MFTDFRYALRSLLRAPGFTAVAVVVLALGIGANTAVFSVINAVLLRPLPYPQPDQLVLLREKMPLFERGSVSLLNYLDWRAGQKSFTDLAITNTGAYNLALSHDGESAPERLRCVDASANLLTVLGQRPELGRDVAEVEDLPHGPKVVLISDALWRRRFAADPHVIGRRVVVDAVAREVIGVLPPEFVYGGHADMIIPLGDTRAERWAGSRANHPGFSVVGRLREGVTLEAARQDLNLIAAALTQQYPDTNTGRSVSMEGLLDSSIREYRRSLYLLLGAVGCVLLIACANVANLQLARATGRTKELAVRAALGAGRGRLMRQMLTESTLLGVLGGMAGVLVAMWAVDAIVALGPQEQTRFKEVHLDWTALGFAAAAALGTGLLVGAWPAWRMSRAASMAVSLHESAARGASGGASRVRVRAFLVVTQVALAVVLLAGAALAMQSFQRMRDLPLGFDPRGILTLSLSLPDAKYKKEAIQHFYDALISRIEALPAVAAAATSINSPFDNNEWDTSVHITGTPPDKPGEEPSAEVNYVSPNYFKVLGMPILRGRGVEGRDAAGQEKVVVIDESLSRKFFSDRDPVGQHLDDGNSQDKDAPPMTIIGVVARTRNDAPATNSFLDKMTQMTQSGGQFEGTTRELLVRVREGDPLRLVEPIRQIVLGLDPEVPIALPSTMERNIDNSVSSERLTMVLLGVFAAVALGLATVGLYGVMALSVTQRTRELGIRMALGAGRGDVLRLVLRQGATLVAVGLGVGLMVALGVGRVLDHYGAGGNDLLTLGIVCAVLAGAALLACWLPARRATRLDPMVALRAE